MSERGSISVKLNQKDEVTANNTQNKHKKNQQRRRSGQVTISKANSHEHERCQGVPGAKGDPQAV